MRPNRSVWPGVAVMLGTMVGAGIFGIPFVVAGAGFPLGLLHVVGIGLLMLAANMMLLEVVIRTPGRHQLAGYALRYLGRWGRLGMLVSLFVGIYGALVAYAIGAGQSMVALLGGVSSFWQWVFFAVGALLVAGGARWLSREESVVNAVKLGVFVVLVFVLLSAFRPDRLPVFPVSSAAAFAPFGVVLFAYLAMVAVPEVHFTLGRDARLTRRAVLWGSLIPILMYSLFALAIVGVQGYGTAEVATIGIGQLGPAGVWLLNGFALLAMLGAFVALGTALRDTYELDYRLPPGLSWLLTLAVPLLVLVTGAAGFTRTLEVSGGIAGGLGGLLVVLMHHRLHPSWWRTVPLVVVFVAAIVVGFV